MAFAENYPNKLQGLVLFHSQAGADSFDAKVNRERVILLVQKDKTRFIKNYIPELFAPVNVHRFSAEIDKLKEQALLAKKPGIIAALKGMRDRPDRRQVLNDISKPVLFIIGKEDRKIPMQVILDQVSLPQHSEMLLLHHVGHMGMLEAARITSKVVWDFSKRCYSEASMVIK